MLTGVFTATKKDGTIYFRSSITYRSKHISLGSYDTEEMAHQAYLDAASVFESSSVFLPEDYSKKICKVLSFQKWITLINFKNNKIYIKTPIYLRSRYFYYYLSFHDVLIFDADDLFYYSKHSIMRRGNHLFVAEYGMQTNIASRYGIRNFARPGIDFRFVNGNSNDFRYENIEVFNKFQGVTVVTSDTTASTRYITKIHINGNYIVGEYDSLTQAAIAYNKAVDIALKKGIQKNFTKNYIEEMSAQEYSEIYSHTDISEKIINL